MDWSELQYSHAPQKLCNPPRGELAQKGGGQVIPKIVAGHGVKWINERATAGFRIMCLVFNCVNADLKGLSRI